MANWVPIGPASGIPEGGCRVLEAGGHTIAIFNLGGALHAIDNTCAHRGGPLGEGFLQGTVVTCPWHYWSYDVTTGRGTMADQVSVRSFAIERRGEDLFVDLG